MDKLEAVKGLQEAAKADGGSPLLVYLLCALAFFTVAVVGYVIRDYASNHVKMILVLEQNNRLYRRLSRYLKSAKRPETHVVTAGNPSPAHARERRVVSLKSAEAQS